MTDITLTIMKFKDRFVLKKARNIADWITLVYEDVIHLIEMTSFSVLVDQTGVDVRRHALFKAVMAHMLIQIQYPHINSINSIDNG